MSKLPKFKRPIFKLNVPSQKRDVNAVPYACGEEKILLMAQESGEESDIVTALKQIVDICVQEEDFDVETLTTFDLEYMFLKLRARSAGNIVTMSYQDLEDEKIYSFEVDLDEVEMLQGADKSNVIKVDDTMGIVLKYPSVSVLEKGPKDVSRRELVEYLITCCIESVYEGEEVYAFSDFDEVERAEFFEQIPIPALQEIRDFFTSLPYMYYKIAYTNSLGTERTIELRKLKDFFTWG